MVTWGHAGHLSVCRYTSPKGLTYKAHSTRPRAPWGGGRGGTPGAVLWLRRDPPPAVSGRRRRLEKACVDLLQTALCPPARPEPLQLLCAAILRELSPCLGLSLSCDHVQSPRQLSLVASVLLAQVRGSGQADHRPLVALGPGRSSRPVSGPRAGGLSWGSLPFTSLYGGLGGQRMDARPAETPAPASPSSPSPCSLPGFLDAECPGHVEVTQARGCRGDMNSP